MNTPSDGHDKSHRQRIPCPECGFFMEVSSSSLLVGNGHTCPSCGITLNIDRSASRDAIADLVQFQMEIETPVSEKKK